MSATLLTNETPAADPVVEDVVTDTPVETTDDVVTDDVVTDTPVEVAYEDFDLPEGVTMDEELLSSAAELFKEAGLTKEQAQKFVDLQSAMIQKSEAVRNDWADKAKSDKEYGGDKFNESVGIAMQAVEKFGTPELKQMLNDTGVGNHPEMIRLLKRVGDLTREDQPNNLGKAPVRELTTLEIMYPN